MLEGLRVTQSLGVREVMVDSDSTQALSTIKDHSSDLSAFGLLAEDALQAAASLFPT